MKYQLLFSSFLLVLMSCNASNISSDPEPPPIPSSSITLKPAEQSPVASSTALAQNSSPASKTLTISAKGIGLAKLGMTFGQLKQVLEPDTKFKVDSPFMVDFDAIALSQSGKVQYYILYPAGTKLADSDPIEMLLTDNPNFRTAKGVRPGTPLEQAEAVYGDATLSYNTSNESREYVKFVNQPAQNLLFRSFAPNQQFAGIYSSPLGEYNETKKFHKSAKIGSILVSQ